MLILTVQSTGRQGSYRLGITLDDSENIFKERHVKVQLILGKEIIETQTTCGPPLKKGFDLYHFQLNNWIVKNNFHKYPSRKPSKLRFNLKKSKDHFILTYIQN